ncbi:MAG: CrcB family protein [Lentisphaeria bacterium]|nr:CrcB family protein [Lentisphaeria bacterium]
MKAAMRPGEKAGYENASSYMCRRCAAGTLLRYFSVKAVNVFAPGSCRGTLSVNIIGAFLAGFCFVLCKNKFSGFQEYFPVLFTGFPGAFTTFSTFALESTPVSF